jgi:hypothetical protein
MGGGSLSPGDRSSIGLDSSVHTLSRSIGGVGGTGGEGSTALTAVLERELTAQKEKYGRITLQVRYFFDSYFLRQFSDVLLLQLQLDL